MKINKIEKLINLSEKIFWIDKEDKTNFSTNKEIIQSIFNNNKYCFKENKNDILLWLTIIDSFYSTNMSRRYFWLEELAKKILIFEKEGISEKIKNEGIIIFIEEYLNKILDKEEWIWHIWIWKQWNELWHSLSLITKYLYFRTNFNFPIYDNLVLNELKINNIKVSLENNENNYFKILNDFKGEFNNSFDTLDKVLWLSWKIRKWNFWLIFKNKKLYLEFLKELKLYKLEDEAKKELLNEFKFYNNKEKLKNLFNKHFWEIILIKINKYNWNNNKIVSIKEYYKLIKDSYIQKKKL